MKTALLLLLISVAANFPSHLRAAETRPPNIVIFLVDDMGVMDTSVPFLTDEKGQPQRYPLNDFYRTPNLERLASQGIRFNNFYAMSVCSPTRISLMTGQNAARHRTTNWINSTQNNAGPKGPPDWNWNGLRKTDVTLARILQLSGYRTIHIGKGHFGPEGSAGADPLQLGFDVNIGGASYGSPGSYLGQENFARDRQRGVPNLEKYHGENVFLTEALSREAQAQVSQYVQNGEPFFLYFSHYAAHSPFQTDSRFVAHYKDSGKPAPAQAFATLIEGMDQSLGDLLDHLSALGAAENTLIFFLGDNGSDAPLGGPHEIACAAPLRGKKGSHYEGGMRVPFIAAWGKADNSNPNQGRFRIRPGVIQSQVASVCDLFPTILLLTGIAPPASHVVDGSSLDTLLRAEQDSACAETFLMHYPHAPHRSDYFTVFREGPWKLIYHYFPSPASEDSHYQLYNLAADPFEQSNVAPSEQQELLRLMQKLIDALEHCEAVYPLNDAGAPLKPVLP